MPQLVAVMGSTASGKTDLAEQIASRIGAQLINADAFQVYRGMDIGTAKPTQKELYRLIDIKNPDEAFGVGEWALLAVEELKKTVEEKRSAVLVGGTGFYIRAIMDEFTELYPSPDPVLREQLMQKPPEELLGTLKKEYPEAAATVDLANPLRVRRALEREFCKKDAILLKIPYAAKLKVAIMSPKEQTDARIERRASEMLHNGWIEEISRLRDEGYSRSDPGMRAIGYQAIWDFLDRKTNLDEAMATTIALTKQYAKRQRTWLRSEKNVHWIGSQNEGSLLDQAMSLIDKNEE